MNFRRVFDNLFLYVKKKPFRFFLILFSFFFLVYFVFCLPTPVFTVSYSSVLTDSKNEIISARIAEDGQWRFPSSGKVPEKFRTCILQFEDKNFYYHPGVDPLALARAFSQNISSGRRVSGGSTLTMQVVRLARKNKKRTYSEKLIEMVWALRMTMAYSKDEVLDFYATHAPFGSNIVGIEAASWRYFGRAPELLSWSESATLAVLPNSPSLIFPGRNQAKLLEKRNRLLLKLNQEKIIDDETYFLALQEPLPQKAHSIPASAPHLLSRSVADYGKGNRSVSTLDFSLQREVTRLVNDHAQAWRSNEVHNCAALVLEIETGNILAYVGNSAKLGGEEHGNEVDVINAPRSTGSLLKPFLYAGMLNDGVILPHTLVPDVPTQLGGFTPQNFNLTYDGAVPASRALARSLNIPCVRMLNDYGLEKFHHLLKKLGMTTFSRPAEEYGMTLILGGGEGKLIEMCGAYASMARTLIHYCENSQYNVNEFKPPHYVKQQNHTPEKLNYSPVLNAASIYLSFEAMAEVSRPDMDAAWQRLASGQKIAWKTGTSYGFRDGWAIGLNKNYVVGIWVGNADGEGRPGLTGISAAAPLLFRVFNLLPSASKSWFDVPVKATKKIEVCRESGYRCSPNCTDKILQLVPIQNSNTGPCPYHKLIATDNTGNYRVHADCYSSAELKNREWFVLPPAMEYYYKKNHPLYKTLPPWSDACKPDRGKSMEMIYPRINTKIYIPLELQGNKGRTIFELAHRIPGTTVYWDLDGNFLGSTIQYHQMALNPEKGPHVITVTDQNGETLTIPFEVVSENKSK